MNNSAWDQSSTCKPNYSFSNSPRGIPVIITLFTKHGVSENVQEELTKELTGVQEVLINITFGDVARFGKSLYTYICIYVFVYIHIVYIIDIVHREYLIMLYM